MNKVQKLEMSLKRRDHKIKHCMRMYDELCAAIRDIEKEPTLVAATIAIKLIDKDQKAAAREFVQTCERIYGKEEFYEAMNKQEKTNGTDKAKNEAVQSAVQRGSQVHRLGVSE